jgi:hypothetical protein
VGHGRPNSRQELFLDAAGIDEAVEEIDAAGLVVGAASPGASKGLCISGDSERTGCAGGG